MAEPIELSTPTATAPAPKLKKKSSKKSTKPADAGVTKRKHRYKSGTRALLDIKKQQKNSASFALPRAPVKRLTKEIMQNLSDKDYQISKQAIDALMTAAEANIINVFKLANTLSIEIGKKPTLTAKSFTIAAALVNEPHVFNA